MYIWGGFVIALKLCCCCCCFAGWRGVLIGRLWAPLYFFLGRDDGHVSVAMTFALFPEEEENDEIILSLFLYTTIRVERRRVMKEIYSWSPAFFILRAGYYDDFFLSFHFFPRSFSLYSRKINGCRRQPTPFFFSLSPCLLLLFPSLFFILKRSIFIFLYFLGEKIKRKSEK
jgi:hypothetical protein